MTLGLRARIVLAAGAAVVVALALSGALLGYALPEPARSAGLWRLLAAGSAVGTAALAVLGLALWPLVLQPLGQAMHAIERLQPANGEPAPRPPAGDELARLSEGLHQLAQAMAARERELAAARDAAADAQRARSQFMALMSHELRTPLNAVLGMTELLHGSRLDDRQQRFVRQIRESGRALVALIDDVLELTRLQAGMVETARQPFRLREAVLAGVEPFRDAARARGLELDVHVDAALPGVVRGDRAHLLQILGKLLSNAVKFTEHGGVIVRVTPSDVRVRFSVSDTGVGIASEFMPHLYEAFRQADGSPTRRFGGAGMGLAIARRLCLAMGGLIDASSRPGKGSTFWFELPLPAEPGGMPDAAIERTPAATPPG